MSDRLDAIKRRALPESGSDLSDVTWLVAEVERLKQENRELKTRLYLVHRSILAPMALVERMDAATAGVPTARLATLDGES